MVGFTFDETLEHGRQRAPLGEGATFSTRQPGSSAVKKRKFYLKLNFSLRTESVAKCASDLGLVKLIY